MANRDVDADQDLAPAEAAGRERLRDLLARRALASGATESSRSRMRPSAADCAPFPAPAGSIRA